MKKIGITGGIGSGKTTVCEIFRILGVKVYNADIRSGELLNSNKQVIECITEKFGREIYNSGKADRKMLAGKVFSNPEALALLNSIVHPAVFADFDHWLDENKKETYIIKEAAIMFETGANKQLDAVVLVYSPAEIRIQRVMMRDKTGKDAVMARVKNQMDDDQKIPLSDYLIYNDDEHSLIKQVLNLDKIFKTL